MSFDLLSNPIKEFIYNKNWKELRPIQKAAIERIINSNENFILASRTASGKTEAAFLPIISKIDLLNEQGVQVLYISPLRALINDQFERLEELCNNLDIKVTKWHGEAKISLKNKLLKEPKGIVLITLESLEAMFVNKPYNIKHLFYNLKYIIIDELHHFLSNEIGIQLKSLISRLQIFCENKFSIIGLSATIGNYDEAKKITGSPNSTKVLLDKTPKETEAFFRYIPSSKKLSDLEPLVYFFTTQIEPELISDLYENIKNKNVLIFPNSRGHVEEVSVKLKKKAELSFGHKNYFSHHSSIEKTTREFIEFFAKNLNSSQNFCISCTTTLELGIDIGSIDSVVQINSTNNVSSLIQRIGRSGRKDKTKSQLYLYATNPWSLLQSVACFKLYKEGFIEEPIITEKPFDILLHQILSIIKERSGLELEDLILRIKNNFAFSNISENEIREIILELIEKDYLEKIKNEVIIGIEGEKLINNKDFYSVFKSEDAYKIVYNNETIGTVSFTPEIIEKEKILLSAKIWEIIKIDYQYKRIDVIPANDGKRTLFKGEGGIIDKTIREKMLEILMSSVRYDFLDYDSIFMIDRMRQDFKIFDINISEFERPIFEKNNELYFFSFTGTRINRTLNLLFKIAGYDSNLSEFNSLHTFKISFNELINIIEKVKKNLENQNLNLIDNYLLNEIETKPSLIEFSKWGIYLPLKFKLELLKEKYFDFNYTKIYLSKLKLSLPTNVFYK